MSEGFRPEAPADRPVHLFDAASDQREKVVGAFGDQREALMRAVEDQRLGAMPERLRPGGPAAARASAEIVQALQQMIAREVTRQLELAIRTMIAKSAPPAQDTPKGETPMRGGAPM